MRFESSHDESRFEICEDFGLRASAPAGPDRAVRFGTAQGETEEVSRSQAESRSKSLEHDVTIIGGSYAGLAAALQLGRARRSVLIIDAGQRRNRFAHHAHGFLGQDGVSPAEIAANARAEVLKYPTVRWLDATVSEAKGASGGFTVRAGGEDYQSRRMILATGVRDQLPDVPGLTERWGETVFHCPYCHGYELGKNSKLGALATSPLSIHHAVLAAEWGASMTLFLNQALELDADQVALLNQRGIRVERSRVVAAEGAASAVELRLEDGRTTRLDGLFVATRTAIDNPFAGQLGLQIEEGLAGPFYKTDSTKETTVPGVFACGDAALAMGSVSFAVADGVMAGIAAHRSLVFGN